MSPTFSLHLLSFAGLGRQDGGMVQGYPPCNLERIAGVPERLRLIVAVAGFAPRELDVSVTDRHLLVTGDQKRDGRVREFLHRGIAQRRFQKVFRLADGLEVVGADLADGLLSVEMERRDRPGDTTAIAIMTRDGAAEPRGTTEDNP